MQSLLQQMHKKINAFGQGDRTLLLTCMGISLFLWIVVKMSGKYDSYFPVHLSFDVKHGYALKQMPDTDFNIKIRGSGWDLMKLHISQTKLTLPYVVLDERPFPVGGDLLRSDILHKFGSKKISIASLPFEQVYLQAEEQIEKKVPIRFISNITCASGYQLVSPPSCSPDSLTVKGARSNILPITSWPTDSLILNEIATNQTLALSLNTPRPELQLDIDQVTVDVPVEQFTQKSFFVPVQIVNAPETPDSLSLFPKQIKVNCVVGFSEYKNLKSSDFILEADLTNVALNANKNTAPLALKSAPPYVKNISFIPKAVSFYFIKKDSTLLVAPPTE